MYRYFWTVQIFLYLFFINILFYVAAIKKIEERTLQFIEAHTQLKEANKMVTHEELAKIIGAESKTTITEILKQRQNIQPQQWDAFRKHFEIRPEISDHWVQGIGSTGGQVKYINLKTASGNLIKIKPDEDKIALVNAFIEERDKAISNLETDKQKLQKTIDANLTALMTLLAALSRHDRAFHETILKSLSRLEGGNADLIGEARSYEAVMQAEEFLAGSKSQAGT